MRSNKTILSIFAVLFWGLSHTCFAETQTSVQLTTPELFVGNSGDWSVSQTSGPVAVANGTVTYNYNGVTSFAMEAASGRYAGFTGNVYYGLTTGPFQIFRSFLTQNFFTVGSSSTLCPGATTSYNFLNIRVRTKDAPRNPMNPFFSGFLAGGTLTYDPSLAHLVTLNTTFDLAGPTVNASPAATYDQLTSSCDTGAIKVQGTGANNTLDQYGTFFFGDSTMLYESAAGNPIISLGVPSYTMNTANMAALSTSVFSGLYTYFTNNTSQTQKNVFLYPNAAGTTYTVYTSDSLTDPTLKTSYGTLTCTTLNSPSNGFCSGTLTLSGVTGTGKAVCMLSTTTPDSSMECIAQYPGDTTKSVTIMAHVPAKAVLAVSVPATAASVAPNGSTTITATLQNMTGAPIITMGNPASGALQLAAPFTDPAAFTGAGGTCGSSLSGYASCTVSITYHPIAVGTSRQIFRVAYNDNYFGTVNATIPVIGTSGISSITVTPSTSTYASGTSVQYTATATYTDLSTQDVTTAVNWSTDANASVNSTGTVTFTSNSSTTISAALAATTGTKTVTETLSSILDLGQSTNSGIDAAASGMSQASYLLVKNNQLFLSDTGNSRLLIWNSIPTANQQAPDLVLGQATLLDKGANNGGISASTLSSPMGISSDGTNLVVADNANNRVLIYNSIPNTNGAAADVVLGQPDFTSKTANNGGRNGKSMSAPTGVMLTSLGTLYVADTSNNRVLVWTTLPVVNQTTANFVLGQTSTTVGTANQGGISGATLSAPVGINWDGTHLLVADASNNRVLVWNSAPLTNGQTANFALGQTSLSVNTANNGGRAASTLSLPEDVTSDGTHVFVTDYSNHRLLQWNSFPSVSGTSANFEMGQPGFTQATANNGGIAAKSLNNPRGVAFDGTRIFVGDYSNNRALIWSSVPAANQVSANIELGQPNMTSSTANNQGSPTASTLNLPQGISGDGSKVYVADYSNNRVLIWTALPTSTNQSANIVLGQPSLTTNTANNGGRNGKSLSSPAAVYSDGTHLLVADTGNNRVLIWNTIPVASQTTANIVLGQTSTTVGTANQGGISGSTMSGPTSVYSDGTRVFVADFTNNRVLVWSSFPVSNGQTASFVLGQTSFTSATANNGGRTGQTLSGPRSVHGDGTNYYIADSANNRVLMWTSRPTTTAQTCTYVLGQPNTTVATANNGGIKGTTMSNPRGVYTDGTKLFVSDASNNRVLVWNAAPTGTQQTATSVIGQPSTTTNTANNGGVSGSALFTPYASYGDGSRLWIVDSANSRILISPYNALLTLSDGPTYDYGYVGFNTSVDHAFTLTNTGVGSATSVAIGTPSLSAPFSFKGGSFPGTGGTCTTTIVGNSSCTIVITANPTVDYETFTDTVRVSFNDGLNTKYTAVKVTASSIPAAVLTFTDTPPYNFGTAVHSSGTIAHGFTLSNTSGVTASFINEVSLSAPFSFTGGNYPGLGGTCGTVLKTGTTCTINVTFTPTAVGTSNSTLSVQYDDHTATQTLSIAIQGTGS